MKFYRVVILPLKGFWWWALPLFALYAVIVLVVIGKIGLAEFAGLSATIVGLAGLLFAVNTTTRQENLLTSISTRLSMEPYLTLQFLDGSSRVTLAADWSSPDSGQRPSGLLESVFPAQSFTPMPAGHAPVVFRIKNTGQAEARNVCVFVDVPSGCKVVEPHRYIMNPVKFPWKSMRDGPHRIQIEGDGLGPELSVRVLPYQWVVYPEPSREYVFTFTAHCGNRAVATKGNLTVGISANTVPPTKKFPGETDLFVGDEDDPTKEA